MNMRTEVAIKELESSIFEDKLHSLGLEWRPKNRYEWFKRYYWPAWLKRWQPVKYGWVKKPT